MKHLSESELALHYYGDADDPAAAKRHLAECAQCRLEFAQLQAVLAAVTMPAPEPAAGYETEVWNNLRAHLPERRQARSWWWLAMPQRWAAAGALAGIIVAAFFLGRWAERRAPQAGGAAVQTAANSAVRDRVLLVAVGDHLERSQMILVELTNTDPARRVDISGPQQAARLLLADNRLYRQTAAQVQDRAVADVLDQLERLLVDLSHRPATVSGSEFEEIRQKIEAQGILFKVRVIGSQVRQRERDINTSAAGPAQKTRT
jgi:hypothetical protein